MLVIALYKLRLYNSDSKMPYINGLIAFQELHALLVNPEEIHIVQLIAVIRLYSFRRFAYFRWKIPEMRKLFLFIGLGLLILQSCTSRMDKYMDHLDEGITHMYYSRFESALESLDMALRYNPKSHEAHFYRGNVHRNMQMYDEAMSDYTKAIQLYPQYADAYFNRGLLKEFLSNSLRAGCEDFIMAEQYGKDIAQDKTRWCY